MNEEQIRISPVRKSLTRPQLMFGCDRVLFLLLLIVCMALGLPGGFASQNYFNVFLSVVIFFVGTHVLRNITKFDSKAFPIFQRSVKYSDSYVAVPPATYKDNY